MIPQHPLLAPLVFIASSWAPKCALFKEGWGVGGCWAPAGPMGSHLCRGLCGAPDPCLSWVLLTPAGKILGGARWSLQQGSLRATAQQGSRREH